MWLGRATTTRTADTSESEWDTAAGTVAIFFVYPGCVASGFASSAAAAWWLFLL